MASLLGALLRNESGGRNIPNVHQGTSSGQAQGYFQITTGTWDEFGGRKYAPNPLQATPEQQAEIASRIPLKRWDPSTIRLMQATGKPLDRNRTLGENLAMNGESFAGNWAVDSGQPVAAQPTVMDGPKGNEQSQPAGYSTRPQGPVEAAGGGRGSDPANPAMTPASTGGAFPSVASTSPYSLPDKPQKSRQEKLADMFGEMGDVDFTGGSKWQMPNIPTQPGAAIAQAQPQQPVNPQQADMRRQQLAMAMQRLNQGSLI